MMKQVSASYSATNLKHDCVLKDWTCHIKQVRLVDTLPKEYAI